MRRSVLLCLAVVAIQASAAIAQPAQPWTGIAANEARADNGQMYGQGDNEMSSRSMSADGRFVVFDSSLSHLVYGDTNNWNDVFLRDRQTGELRGSASRAMDRRAIITAPGERSRATAATSRSIHARRISILPTPTTRATCSFTIASTARRFAPISVRTASRRPPRRSIISIERGRPLLRLQCQLR